MYLGWFYLPCQKVKTPKCYTLQMTATRASINNEKSLLGEMAHPESPPKSQISFPRPPQEAVSRSFYSSGLSRQPLTPPHEAPDHPAWNSPTLGPGSFFPIAHCVCFRALNTITVFLSYFCLSPHTRILAHGY